MFPPPAPSFILILLSKFKETPAWNNWPRREKDEKDNEKWGEREEGSDIQRASVYFFLPSIFHDTVCLSHPSTLNLVTREVIRTLGIAETASQRPTHLSATGPVGREYWREILRKDLVSNITSTKDFSRKVKTKD